MGISSRSAIDLRGMQLRAPASEPDPMTIGIVAPPWLPVPPPAYGGTELIIDVLARGLSRRGHDVALFATGDSTCTVRRAWLYPRADAERIGSGLVELRHVAAAYEALAGCDIVHDHTLAGPFLRHLHGDTPVVTTNHGPFEQDLADLYRHTGAEVPLIAISADQASRAPANVPVSTVIHHGLDLDRYRFSGGPGSYLAALGRMHPHKGIDVAIAAARQAGVPLLIAAKMREPAERQYFDTVIEPVLGGGIEYVGELGHDDKVRLLGGATALLNPIQWPEPFGLVMIEAMACGVPVIATPRGAAPELVVDGVNGYLAEPDRLAAAIRAVGAIDRRQCRRQAETRFSMDAMARDHETFYRAVRAARSAEVTGRQVFSEGVAPLR